MNARLVLTVLQQGEAPMPDIMMMPNGDVDSFSLTFSECLSNSGQSHVSFFSAIFLLLSVVVAAAAEVFFSFLLFSFLVCLCLPKPQRIALGKKKSGIHKLRQTDTFISNVRLADRGQVSSVFDQ